MKFSTPCCISRNTLGIRMGLENLGYSQSSTFDENQGYIWTSGDKYYSTDNIPSLDYGDYDSLYGYFCGYSEESFLGIAALRSDDSDRYQWFFDDQGVWEKVDSDLPSRYMQMEGHKATPEDILNCFKS